MTSSGLFGVYQTPYLNAPGASSLTPQQLAEQAALNLGQIALLAKESPAVGTDAYKQLQSLVSLYLGPTGYENTVTDPTILPLIQKLMGELAPDGTVGSISASSMQVFLGTAGGTPSNFGSTLETVMKWMNIQGNKITDTDSAVAHIFFVVALSDPSFGFQGLADSDVEQFINMQNTIPNSQRMAQVLLGYMASSSDPESLGKVIDGLLNQELGSSNPLAAYFDQNYQGFNQPDPVGYLNAQAFAYERNILSESSTFWSGLSQDYSEALTLKTVVEKDLATLQTNPPYSQGQTILQEMQGIAAGTDPRFADICTSSNPQWLAFQTKLSGAVSQSVANQQGLQIPNNIYYTNPDGTSGNLPFTEPNIPINPDPNARYTITLPPIPYYADSGPDTGYMTLDASFLTPTQEKNFGGSFSMVMHYKQPLNLNLGDLNVSITCNDGKNLIVTFTGTASDFGAVPIPVTTSMAPLINFLSGSLN